MPERPHPQAKGSGEQGKRRQESAPSTNEHRDWYWVKDEVRADAGEGPDLQLEIDSRGTSGSYNPGSKPGGPTGEPATAARGRPAGPSRGRPTGPPSSRSAGSSSGGSSENSPGTSPRYSSGESTEYSSGESTEYSSSESTEYSSGESTEYSPGESVEYSPNVSVEYSSGETVEGEFSASSGEWAGSSSGDSTGESSDSCSGQSTHDRCSIQELLHSIALEELAFAHLINVEAEKAQKVAEHTCTVFTPDEVIEFQHSIAKVLEQAVAKEQLLFKKLRLLLHECTCHHDDCT